MMVVVCTVMVVVCSLVILSVMAVWCVVCRDVSVMVVACTVMVV